jgi:hypothetical protein
MSCYRQRMHPQNTQINTDTATRFSTQRREDAKCFLRPSTVRRGCGRPMAAVTAVRCPRSENEFSMRGHRTAACALKAQASPSLFFLQKSRETGTLPHPRRQSGAEPAHFECAGRGESGRRRAFMIGDGPIPLGGWRSDRLPFCPHAQHRFPGLAQAPLRLGVFAPLRFFWVGGRPSCLRVLVVSKGWVGGSGSICVICGPFFDNDTNSDSEYRSASICVICGQTSACVSVLICVFCGPTTTFTSA